MQFLKSSFVLVWEIWLLLLTGYIWVVLAPFTTNDVEGATSASSVLVGAAIAAQLIFDNMAWRKQYTDPEIQRVKLNDSGHINTKLNNCIGVGYGFTVGEYKPTLFEKYTKISGLNSRFDHLMILGTSDTDEDGWCDFRETKKRVEFWVTYVLAASVLLGTLTWGYGLTFSVIGLLVLSYLVALLFSPR